MRAAGTCRWPRASIRHLSHASRRNCVDSKLLEILVCPVTKGPLVYDRERQELISKSARLAYPIRDGIPVMLEEEARKLEPAEYERASSFSSRRASRGLGPPATLCPTSSESRWSYAW